ncbi:MAG: TonB-dependent receptor plug domain-containing protein [Thermoanaerobaculia bacterium]
MKFLVSTLLTLLFVCPLAAADPEPVAFRDEIVVTASTSPEELDATPASVTVIDAYDIEARHARDVADVLREVPGLAIARSGSAGKATSLFGRGGNSQHTLVLWNGVEINNPYFSGYDWGRFTATGVERVEVVRGPFSSIYGSDAVAGVVNILTVPNSSGIAVDAQAGSHGLRNAAANASWLSGPFTLAATVERREDDGWSANDDFAQDAFSAIAGWRRGDFTAAIQARVTSYELGIPFNSSADGTAIVPSLQRRQDGSERQIAIPIRDTVGRLAWEVVLSESARNDDFDDPADPWGITWSQTDSTTRRAQARVRAATPIGTVTAGGEYERATVDDVYSLGTNLDDSKRSSRSWFVEDRVGFDVADGRIELSAGIRHDDFDTFGARQSPRVAAAWLRGSHKVRASYGEGFRAPSVGELYYPWSGNTELEAETSRSAEAGYDYYFANDGVASATLFHSRFDDLIVFDNASFRFANIGRARSQGVELSVATTLREGLIVSGGYTYTDTEEDATGEPLLRRPRHSGSASVAWSHGAVRSSAVFIYAGTRDDVLPVYPYVRTANTSYTTVDLSVGVAFGRFEPYVKVENATGEEYEEVLGYAAPGRRAIAGVRYTLD